MNIVVSSLVYPVSLPLASGPGSSSCCLFVTVVALQLLFSFVDPIIAGRFVIVKYLINQFAIPLRYCNSSCKTDMKALVIHFRIPCYINGARMRDPDAISLWISSFAWNVSGGYRSA